MIKRGVSGHCMVAGPRTFLNDPSVKKGDIFQFLIEGTFRGRETSAALVVHLFEI